MDVAEWVGMPRDVVFLSGAGVSSDAPTCLPLGNDLTERVLCHAFWGVDPKEVAEVFRVAGMPGAYPRLETVLGAAYEVHGEVGLRFLLSDVLEAAPNELHRFFARHLCAGGAHVTANVDPAIERAAAALGLSLRGLPLLHFHGVALPGTDLSRLGVTLPAVETGFRPEMSQDLDAVVRAGYPRTLVVLGYSGLDYFDMGPYLRGLASGSALRGWTVIWVDHDARNEDLRRVPSPPPSTALGATLRALSAAGAECQLIRGRTRSVIGQLARRWNLTWEDPGLRVDGVRWSGDNNPLVDDQRQLAAVRLCDRLGLVGPLRKLVKQNPGLLRRETADAIAMAHWESGRFGRARQAWSQAWDLSTPDGRLLFEERRAACDWQRGSYLRALRRLERALDSLPTGCDMAARLVVADTLARVLDHMSRWPDVRHLATPKARARALAALPTPEEVRLAGLGQDLVSRAAAGRSKLTGGQPDAPSGQEVNAAAYEWHAQTSSVVRTLAYEQGQLRGLARPDDAVRQRYLRLWAARDAIGMANLGTATLPFAVDAFGARRVARELWNLSVRVTLWHRVRLTVGVAAQAVRGRLVERARPATRGGGR